MLVSVCLEVVVVDVWSIDDTGKWSNTLFWFGCCRHVESEVVVEGPVARVQCSDVRSRDI